NVQNVLVEINRLIESTADHRVSSRWITPYAHLNAMIKIYKNNHPEEKQMEETKSNTLLNL
ncbi:MAG TPA: hypothetical protein VHA13_01105, partial [Gammaproteobacteria bacterium]|nr:hypothetical protein [Gammaproteobacteria bacterium]